MDYPATESRSIFSDMLAWLAWRLSAVGRAASSFRRSRHDYYMYLGQLLRDSRGKKTMLDIFWKDAERYGKKPRGVLSKHWCERHQDGADLIKTWTGTLPHSDLLVLGAAVRAGGAGAIEDALDDAARLAQRSEESKRQFTETIFVGALAIALAVGTIVGVPLFFLPLLQDAFSFVPLDMWGPKGLGLRNFGSFISAWWWACLIAICTALAGGFAALPRWTGELRAKFDCYFLPYRLYRDARAAEFMATLATVLKKRGNVSLNMREGLELVRNSSGPWLREHVERMLAVLNEPGEHDESNVLDSGLLTKENVYYVADMIETLGPDEGIQIAGRRIEQNIQRSIEKTAKRLRLVMLLSGVGTIFYMAYWMNAVIGELKTATSLVFS